ncbi:hypothetical protein E2C01_031831 [Portunus trituberculatus]|uniref:Uncharacterized protein n=1 Tax=Portunus trituberculatus TaxID=210409 RepID=A0A5B7EYX0_PORTR|nr:hypothetical protein [Portunus trituberculatus]
MVRASERSRGRLPPRLVLVTATRVQGKTAHLPLYITTRVQEERKSCFGVSARW